jgi:site-specific recombinase XerC
LESLNVSQMDMRLDFVRVKNKGSQTPKPLPYGRILKDSVQRWLIWRAREVEMGEDALLIDANSGTRLSISRIREIVINLGDRANVSVNPHRFRDSLGTKLIDSDVSVERVMQVFGHTNRAQTLAYTKLGDRKVKEEHERVMDPILSALLETDLPDTKEIEPPPGWPRRKKNQ